MKIIVEKIKIILIGLIYPSWLLLGIRFDNFARYEQSILPFINFFSFYIIIIFIASFFIGKWEDISYMRKCLFYWLLYFVTVIVFILSGQYFNYEYFGNDPEGSIFMGLIPSLLLPVIPIWARLILKIFKKK